LQDLAGQLADLLAETARLALGTSESRGPEYEAQAQAVAELYRLAGADKSLIRSGSRKDGAGPRLRGDRRSRAASTR
jgi:hypothetical protein